MHPISRRKRQPSSIRAYILGNFNPLLHSAMASLSRNVWRCGVTKTCTSLVEDRTTTLAPSPGDKLSSDIKDFEIVAKWAVYCKFGSLDLWKG